MIPSLVLVSLISLLSATPERPVEGALFKDGSEAFATAVTDACKDVSPVWPVPAALVRAVIRQESAFDARATSKAGAIGLMQVMPFNAPKVGMTEAELWDPAKNILAGTRLLAVLLKHYQGDLLSTLAAYNARPRKLFAPLPNNGETPQYVKAVLRYYRAYGGKTVSPPPRADTARATTGPR